MARLAAFVLLLLSLLAVAHSRLIDPSAASDDRDPPEHAAAAQHSEPAIPTELVAVPLHRLAGPAPGVLRDGGFSLRLPSHGRRHPCHGTHALGNRWLARHHLHQGALAGGGFPGEARDALAAAADHWVPERPKSRREGLAEPDLDTDLDSDDEGEDGEENMGKGWKKARKRFHHHDGEEGEEETRKRWKKEVKRALRLSHHSRRHHHHHAEVGGIIKWFGDLLHF